MRQASGMQTGKAASACAGHSHRLHSPGTMLAALCRLLVLICCQGSSVRNAGSRGQHSCCTLGGCRFPAVALHCQGSPASAVATSFRTGASRANFGRHHCLLCCRLLVNHAALALPPLPYSLLLLLEVPLPPRPKVLPAARCCHCSGVGGQAQRGGVGSCREGRALHALQGHQQHDSGQRGSSRQHQAQPAPLRGCAGTPLQPAAPQGVNREAKAAAPRVCSASAPRLCNGAVQAGAAGASKPARCRAASPSLRLTGIRDRGASMVCLVCSCRG